MHRRIQEIAWAPTRCMLVDNMTKNMRDVLITQMTSTGQWCPDESDVHVASDVFFSSDPVAACVRNGRYCIVHTGWSGNASLDWHSLADGQLEMIDTYPPIGGFVVECSL